MVSQQGYARSVGVDCAASAWPLGRILSSTLSEIEQFTRRAWELEGRAAHEMATEWPGRPASDLSAPRKTSAGRRALVLTRSSFRKLSGPEFSKSNGESELVAPGDGRAPIGT